MKKLLILLLSTVCLAAPPYRWEDIYFTPQLEIHSEPKLDLYAQLLYQKGRYWIRVKAFQKKHESIKNALEHYHTDGYCIHTIDVAGNLRSFTLKNKEYSFSKKLIDQCDDMEECLTWIKVNRAPQTEDLKITVASSKGYTK